MKRYVLIFLSLCLGQICYSLEVVYPKKNIVSINSPSTFFVGSSDPKKPLYINGTKVPVHISGGFAYPVKLNTGENKFVLVSGTDKLNFKITKPVTKYKPAVPGKYTEYPAAKYGIVKSDLTPLRKDPVNAGINRMAHLQQNIPLQITGEKNGFYKIKLSSKEYGWIMKSQVIPAGAYVEPAEINGYDLFSDSEYNYFIFHLSSRTLWSLEEKNDNLILKLYNISGINSDHFEFDIDTKKLMSGRPLEGYNAYYDGNDFVLKIRKPLKINSNNPLKGIKIAIDAGHGGNEFGAIGCLGDKEKDINLKYANLLSEKLKSKGAKVIMIRTDDSFVSLQDRVNKTNEKDAFIFISLHANALPDSLNPLTHSGAELYYYYEQTKPLADSIMDSFVNNAGMKNNGIFQRSFAVVRNSAALSILIETGYLINPEDNANIISDDFRKKTVDAIINGLEQYLKSII